MQDVHLEATDREATLVGLERVPILLPHLPDCHRQVVQNPVMKGHVDRKSRLRYVLLRVVTAGSAAARLRVVAGEGVSAHVHAILVLDLLGERLCLGCCERLNAAQHLALLVYPDRNLHRENMSVPREQWVTRCWAL